MAHLKGQHVNLFIENGSAMQPLTASTNCSLNITANTADASAKDDPGLGFWDNPDFTNYTWNMSNESFIVSIQALVEIILRALNNAPIVALYHHKNTGPNAFARKGNAYISSLSIDAANGDFAKLSLSLDGSGELSNYSGQVPEIAVNNLPKIKGKALMVAIQIGDAWKTIACAKSHKLTISNNLTDITDKDYNDSTVIKEVTGKSVTLSTENLIDNLLLGGSVRGANIDDMYINATAGNTVKLQFGYYPDSIGSSIHETDDAPDGWGAADSVLLEGDFLITSFASNGSNKEDADFTAEFKSKGEVILL